jgi:hypothetical protein
MTPSFGLRHLLLASLALAVAGCAFEPSYPEGTIACSASQPKACPSGFQCIAGYCRSHEWQDAQPLEDGPPKPTDAGGADLVSTDGAPGRDAGKVDLAPLTDARPTDGLADTRPTDTLLPRDGLPPDLGPTADTGVADAPRDVPPAGDTAFDAPGPLVDAPVDTAADVPSCVDPCKPGETRCAPAGGVQSCQLVGGCPAWGTPTPCTGRQVCQGTPPAATCACPDAPVGCEGGKGSVCLGNTLRTCKVGPADGCIFEDTALTCPAAKPCLGTFPSAACTCPPPPAACGGAQGTYCESSGVVVTCGLDANGCLTATTRTACAVDKPCTGTFPSASCSCGAGPAECGGTTGTICVTGSRIETCALTSAGCLALASINDCPVGTICQGAAPNAACVCPPPPAECSQGVGTSCDLQGNLATCARDPNGCLVVTQRNPCPGVTTCQGSGPNASCACPPAPTQCSGAGKACVNASTLMTCVADAQGCVSGTNATCSLPGQTCQGAFPNAACACTPNPDCPNGVGEFCTTDTTTLSCKLNSAGCLVSSKHECKVGDYCNVGICETPKAIGWYDDLTGKGEQLPKTLTLIPIRVDFPAIVRGLGVIAREQGTVLLGLYDSTTTEIPYKPLLTNLKLPLEAGRNEFRDLPKTITLNPGLYWIATAYETTTIIAESLQAQISCRIDTTYDYGASFPSPWKDPIIIREPTCPVSNYYLLVTPR